MGFTEPCRCQGRKIRVQGAKIHTPTPTFQGETTDLPVQYHTEDYGLDIGPGKSVDVGW